MVKLSNVYPHKPYNEDEVVNIGNIKQTSLYIQNGSYPIDIFCNEGKIYHVFKKEDTKVLYDMWNKRELEADD